MSRETTPPSRRMLPRSTHAARAATDCRRPGRRRSLRTAHTRGGVVGHRWHGPHQPLPPRPGHTDELNEECSFAVPARSLLLALRAAWDDARAEGAWTDVPTTLPPLEEPQQVSGQPREPGPANSHQPWTRDLDERLRREWLDADPETDAQALIAGIAESMGRTHGAIYSRLLRLKCNPEAPGHQTGPAPSEAG